MTDVTLIVQQEKPVRIQAVYIPGPSAGGGGGGSAYTYVHTQVNANTSWAITHNMGKYPAVAIIDSGGDYMLADVSYTNENQLTVNFAAPVSGIAYLN